MPKSKTDRDGIFPLYARNGNDTTGKFQRYGAVPTVAELKERALFGIPLTSALTGQTITDAALKHYIDGAISEIEHDLDLYITPVRFNEKHDYNANEFNWNYNYIKLQHPNVLAIEKVQLTFSNGQQLPGMVYEDDGVENNGGDKTDLGNPMIDFPIEFVTLMPQEGVMQLVPAWGTSTSGLILSTMSGAQYTALRAMGVTQFPAGVRIQYISGFEKDMIPTAVVELIENMAAYKILTFLGPLIFPHTSVGVSIDGTSQSVSTPGPMFLAQRIKDLKEIVEAQKDVIRGYYQRKFLLDSF